MVRTQTQIMPKQFNTFKKFMVKCIMSVIFRNKFDS
eukprot:UN00409